MPPDPKIRRDQKKPAKAEAAKKKPQSTVSSNKESSRDSKYRSGSVDRRDKPPHQAALNPGRTRSVDRVPKPEVKVKKESDRNKGKSKLLEEAKNKYGQKAPLEERKKSTASTVDKSLSIKKSTEKSSSSITSKKPKPRDSSLSTRSSDKTKHSSNASGGGKSSKRTIPENKGKERSRTFTKPTKLEGVPLATADDTKPSVRPGTSTIRKGPPTFVEKQEKTQEIEKSSIVHEDIKIKPEKEVDLVENSSLEVSAQGDENNYEDDFEDYESDFEDESDVESVTASTTSESDRGYEEIKDHSENIDNTNHNEQENDVESTFGLLLHPTIVKRNQPVAVTNNATKSSPRQVLRMSESFSKTKTSPDTEVVQTSNTMKKSRSSFNFASAKEEQQKKKVINKVMKRGSELLEIIVLDKVNFDVFDMPPMKYDTYIRSFGRSNTKQAYIQTENYEEEEVQTEEIAICDKWTQHPPNDPFGVGGDINSTLSGQDKDWKSHFKTDAVKLNKFMQNVSPVVLALLAEDCPILNLRQIAHTNQEIFFSQGYYVLNPLPILKGASVLQVCFSPVVENYMLSIHGDLSSGVADIDEKGIICIWNLFNVTEPEFVLTSNSQPVCACFGPGDSSTVVAGMVDGAVMLWDLTEQASAHSSTVFEDIEIVLRSPTYNTAAVVGENQHHSCIASIQALQGSHSKPDILGSGTKDSKGFSKNFHVLSLEDMGIINIWVVVEVHKPESYGSETDLGLAPGGKLKLVRSSTIDVHSLSTLSSVISNGIRTFEFRALPSDPNHLLITTDAGIVIHATRHSGTASPKFYSHDSDFSLEIRSIDCSTHNDFLFLVGCSDGSVRLHNVKSARPVMVWPQAAGGESVLLVQWSARQPAIFYVLDSLSNIYMWDLRQKTSVPTQVHNFLKTKVTWFSLNGKNLQKKDSDRPSQMAISKENGDIEIHALKQQVDVIPEVEYLRQLHFMQNL